MAEITKIQATDTQVTAFNRSVFGYSLILPNRTKLQIKSVELISHSVDGVRSKNASLVFQCKYTEGEGEVTIYINALIKKRYDYAGRPIQTKGTLNLEVRKLIGLTGAKVVEKLKKFVGCEIEAIEVYYKGIDRAGDVRDITYNEYDLITMPAEEPKATDEPEATGNN